MKLITKTILAGLLSSSLSASPFFYSSFDDKFFRINSHFDTLFDSHFRNNFAPKMEIYDDNKSYTIEFEVQGIDKNDLKLSLEGTNLLKLEGEKKNTKNKIKKNEKYYGNFVRIVNLPEDANTAKISTEHKNGILAVNIPKKEMKKKETQTIPIK